MLPIQKVTRTLGISTDSFSQEAYLNWALSTKLIRVFCNFVKNIGMNLNKLVLVSATFLFYLGFSNVLFAQEKQELEYKNDLYFKGDMVYTGTYTEYYDNGNPKIVRNIKNGKENGFVITYFENGKEQEQRSYREGKKEGEWINWNEEGIKIAVAIYLDDKKDGDWFIWNAEGVLLYEMHYKKGKKVGSWKMYDKDGKLVDVRKY